MLRSLAAGLAAAITVDDVSAVIVDRAWRVVGAAGCAVIIARHDGGEPNPVLVKTGGPGAALFDECPELAVPQLDAGTDSRRVNLRSCPHYESAASFRYSLDASTSSTVTMVWERAPVDQEDVEGLAGLCSAALQRAWASSFVGEPGSIEDALNQASIGPPVVDDVTEHKRQLDELRQRYEFERHIAARLQRGLAPRGLPRPEGYEVAARYTAGSDGLHIGGDWYDLIEVDDHRLAFVIGDVVGHGLDAALAMVGIRHALVGLSHALDDPIEVLGRLDDYATNEKDRFVATLVYGILEAETGSVSLSSAGHVPPLLIRVEGLIEPLQTAGAPLGITTGPREATAVVMEPGDALLLYTDGVIEQRGESIDTGVGRLIDVASRPFANVDQLAEEIAVDAAQRDNSDDAAVLIMRRESTRGPRDG